MSQPFSIYTKALLPLLLVSLALLAACQFGSTTVDWDEERAKRDKLTEELLHRSDALSVKSVPENIHPNYQLVLTQEMRLYVAVYMAKTCVERIQPSKSSFDTYLTTTLSADRSPDMMARRTLQVIDATHERWQTQDLDYATHHCLQPYLYPGSVSDTRSGIDLYLAATVPFLSVYSRDGFRSQVETQAAKWFDQPNRGEHFTAWLCRSLVEGGCGSL